VAANKNDFRVKNGLVVEQGASIAGLNYPETDGLEGYVVTTDGAGNLTLQQNAISAATGEPMGFVNRTDSSISFNDVNRTFSIAPVLTSYEVWTKGVKRTITATNVVQIPPATGLYYISYQADGALAYQTSFFNLQTQTPIAYVYWNQTEGYASFFADERHGVVLDWQTHEYLHRTRGAVIASGFAASNYVVGGDGSLDSHMQIDLDGGTFYDEDLKIQITHSNTPTNIWEQDLQGPAKIPMFYLNGNAEWKIDAPTNFPVKQGTNCPQYNLNTSGTWSTEDVGNNKYGVTFILATNNVTYPIIGIIGQGARDTQGDAESISFADLILTGFPVVEFRPLYKLVYKCTGALTNTPSATLVSIWDLRSISSVTTSAYVASDHGALSGLGDDDHLQYVHISNARTITAEHTFGGTQTFDDVNVGGDLTITGNLTVNGTQTILSTETLKVQDNIIVLNAEETGTPSTNVGIEVERGTSTNVQVRWNESTDKWQFTNNGSTYFDLINLNPTDGAGRLIQSNLAGDSWEFGDIALGSQSRESFISTSGQTVFTLTEVYGSQNSILVYVNGVPQFPGENFTLSGTSLTFTSAPDTGSQVLVFGLTPVTSIVTPGDGTVTAKKLAASAYTRDIFVGNGTSTSFNLTSDAGSPLAPFVYVGGILQDPVTHYDINVLVTPQTITFTEAIPNNTDITVVYGPVNVTGVPSDQTITFSKLAPSNFTFSEFTGDGSSVNYTLTQNTALPEQLFVFVAGVPQTPGTSYTVDGYTTLTFSTAPAVGAKIVVRYWSTPMAFGVPNDNTVTTIKVVNGAITQTKLDPTYVSAVNAAIQSANDNAVAMSIALG
jgi:hypothetical protein